MNLYVRDATLYDRATGGLVRGDLRLSPGADGSRESTSAGPAPDDAVIEAGGRLALEGLVNAHHHVYSALARGMPAPSRPPRDFAEILELVWWRLDRCLDLDMVRACALAAGIDALRCGVTRIVDHHASPGAVTDSLATIATALEELGLAHVLCYELSERDGPAPVEAGLAETEAWLAAGRPGLVGLHASFTVGDELLASAVELARRQGTGLHLHVAEDAIDQRRCQAYHHTTVVERLHGAGVLDLPGTILVHGLHLSEPERDLVRQSPAWLAHNPESNLNNAVGRFSWDGMDPARVLIGTDGLHGDVLRSARAAYLVGQADGLAPAAAWQLLGNNLRYLEAHHPAAARRNDLVILDYAPPTPLDAENLAAHACFGLDARHVRTVIAAGRVVLDAGRLTCVDEAATLEFCREQARRLWNALERS
jgi:cytosine/adenosine deaminase-related metal-dependent hydrolase